MAVAFAPVPSSSITTDARVPDDSRLMWGEESCATSGVAGVSSRALPSAVQRTATAVRTTPVLWLFPASVRPIPLVL